MIGMNAEDSLGLTEDVTALGLLSRRGAPAYVGPSAAAFEQMTTEQKLRTDVVKVTKREMETSDKLSKKIGQFAVLAADYTDLAAVQKASSKLIESLVGLLAASRGEEVESVRKSAHVALSKLYEAEVSRALQSGQLKDDPRKDPKVLARPSRSWYTPTNP